MNQPTMTVIKYILHLVERTKAYFLKCNARFPSIDPVPKHCADEASQVPTRNSLRTYLSL